MIVAILSLSPLNSWIDTFSSDGWPIFLHKSSKAYEDLSIHDIAKLLINSNPLTEPKRMLDILPRITRAVKIVNI